YIGWNVVVRHDVGHMVRVFLDIVAIILALRVGPLGVVLIEFPLVVGGQPALPSGRAVGVRAGIVAIPIRPVRSVAGNAVKRHAGGNVVVRHDVLHVARVLGDVVAVILALRIHPLRVVFVEFLLIVGRETSGCVIGVLRIPGGIIILVLWGCRSKAP